MASTRHVTHLDPDQQRALADLASDERSVMLSAARELAEARGLGVPLLRSLGQERRTENRRAMLYALSWQADLRAWWPLLKVIADVAESEAVRAQACEGIGYLMALMRRTRLAYRVGVEVLVWALHDPLVEVRYGAAFALGSSRDASLIPVLAACVDDAGSSRNIVGTVGDEARRAIEWISWS